ncbi:hypothetical protein FNV43_RR12350 [Rhamnella rubrinervis]|uniref:RNase H type-1 domain-containing protein n=1 Tax=Rhamnella rubrinervis TaxID=2594499 RepID=A0A8K0MIS9_9ROSA|nr:hypothetical protein FNV43_RR12350 [Rhamnella rubrinervis]
MDKDMASCLLVSLLYCRWTARNEGLFYGKKHCSVELNNFITEFRRVAEKEVSVESVAEHFHSLVWQSPIQRWTKANVDAAFKGENAAAALVIHNWRGKLIRLESCTFSCRNARLLKRELLIEPRIVLLKEDGAMCHGYLILWRLFNKFSWTLDWEPHETNKVADPIAKYSLRIGFLYSVEFISEGLPPSIACLVNGECSESSVYLIPLECLLFKGFPSVLFNASILFTKRIDTRRFMWMEIRGIRKTWLEKNVQNSNTSRGGLLSSSQLT